MTDKAQKPSVERYDDKRIIVTGPAVVRTKDGGDYELTTNLKLKFANDSEVFLKVWPKEDL